MRRISNGKLRIDFQYNHQDISAIVADPTLELLAESDYIYTYNYRKCRDNGILSVSESIDLLKEQGRWTDEDENRLEIFKNEYKKLQDRLPNLKFHKKRKRAINDILTKINVEIERLYNKKHAFDHQTAESIADRAKRRFIISKNTNILTPNIDLKPSLIDTLVVCYYRDNAISEKDIRLISRTDPWRLYWVVAKETGTSLFNYAATEMTELQYNLCFWSKIYDFAFDSTNKPSDSVIDNDTEFDAWYELEINRLKKEQNHQQDNTISNKSNKLVLSNEKFIMCDEESIDEVRKLNSSVAEYYKKRRSDVINEKGTCGDLDFGDVKQELRLGVNRQNAK